MHTPLQVWLPDYWRRKGQKPYSWEVHKWHNRSKRNFNDNCNRYWKNSNHCHNSSLEPCKISSSFKKMRIFRSLCSNSEKHASGTRYLQRMLMRQCSQSYQEKLRAKLINHKFKTKQDLPSLQSKTKEETYSLQLRIKEQIFSHRFRTKVGTFSRRFRIKVETSSHLLKTKEA